ERASPQRGADRRAGGPRRAGVEAALAVGRRQPGPLPSAARARRGPLPPRGQPRTRPLAGPAVTHPLVISPTRINRAGRPRPAILSPRKLPVKGAPGRPLTASFPGKVGAYREGGRSVGTLRRLSAPKRQDHGIA